MSTQLPTFLPNPKPYSAATSANDSELDGQLIRVIRDWFDKYNAHVPNNTWVNNYTNAPYSEFAEMRDELLSIATTFKLLQLERPVNSHLFREAYKLDNIVRTINRRLARTKLTASWSRRGWPTGAI